jgi:hypothetical protein
MRAVTSQISCRLLVWLFERGVLVSNRRRVPRLAVSKPYVSAEAQKDSRPGVWEISQHPYL